MFDDQANAAIDNGTTLRRSVEHHMLGISAMLGAQQVNSYGSRGSSAGDPTSFGLAA